MSLSTERPALQQLNGDLDPDLSKYRRALRRRIREIAGLGIAGAVVLGILGWSNEYTQTLGLTVLDKSPTLEGANIQTSTLNGSLDLNSMLATLAGSEMQKSAESAVGEDLTVSVVDKTDKVIRWEVTVAGGSEAAVRQALDLYQSKFDAELAASRGKSVDQLRTTFAARTTSAKARLGEIDQALAKEPADSSLSQALGVERLNLSGELRLLTDQDTALEAFAKTDNGRGDSSRIQKAGPSALPFVAGLILGVLLGIAAVIIWAFFDDRIWNRRQIEPHVPLLAIVARSDLPQCDTLITALRRRGTGRGFVLVPAAAGGSVDAARQLGEVLTQSGLEASVGDPANRGLTAQEADADVVLVVAAVKTSERDVVRSMTTLSGAAVRPLGAVLVAPTVNVASEAGE